MQNFTSIDELVKQHNEMKYGTSSTSKEFEIPNTSVEINEMEGSAEQEATAENAEKYITPQANTIRLPPDLKKLGLKTEKENQLDEVLNKIKLPISDEKIMEDLKASPSESRRWFATILLYILGQAHITLKKVGVKAIRTFKAS